MPVTLTIVTDTAAELADFLAVLSASKSPLIVPQQPAPPFPWAEAQPAGATYPASEVENVTAQVMAQVDEALANTELPEPEPGPPKRRRGRPAKVVETAQDEPEAAREEFKPAPDDVDELKAADDEGWDMLQEAVTQEALLREAEAAGRDPAVDHGLALELLRAVYDRPGVAAKVAELLAGYGVSKFTQVPRDKGTELLAQARALDAENPA